MINADSYLQQPELPKEPNRPIDDLIFALSEDDEDQGAPSTPTEELNLRACGSFALDPSRSSAPLASTRAEFGFVVIEGFPSHKHHRALSTSAL